MTTETLTIEDQSLALYLDLIGSIVRMLAWRSSERNLVKLEDELARLCSIVASTKCMRFDDEYREEYGRMLDGDSDGRF